MIPGSTAIWRNLWAGLALLLLAACATAPPPQAGYTQAGYAQAGAPLPQIARYDNIDFTEHQISAPEAASYESCASMCAGEPVCRAFTYKAQFARCYLHSQASGQVPYPGAISGVVVSRTGGMPALAAPAPVLMPVAPARGQSCSMASTAKCPGCSVTCQPGQRAVCTPPSDGILSACLENSRCECKGG